MERTRVLNLKDNYPVRTKCDATPKFGEFSVTLGPKPLEFPNSIDGIQVAELKKKAE